MAEGWRPTLPDFVEAAAVILETEPERIERLPGLGLAESALQAPFAGFGDADAYATLLDQAVVLITHLARNHPLPDGNKRVALALTILFLERNGQRWGAPDHDRRREPGPAPVGTGLPPAFRRRSSEGSVMVNAPIARAPT